MASTSTKRATTTEEPMMNQKCLRDVARRRPPIASSVEVSEKPSSAHGAESAMNEGRETIDEKAN